MAITTLAGAAAGMQLPYYFSRPITLGGKGNVRTQWANTQGFPGTGTYSASLAGAALSQTGGAVTGALPFLDPPSGNAYLAHFRTNYGNNNQTLILCDRLWHNGGFTITSTGAQTVNSVAFPARDAAGSTNGDGVFLAVEVSATVGAATPTITVSYTNSDGTSGRTATNIDATESSADAATVYRMSLEGTDTGVRSVQSLTLDASYVSGTINLVAYRPIAMVEALSVISNVTMLDAVTSGFPRLFAGSTLYTMTISTAWGNDVTGHIAYTFG